MENEDAIKWLENLKQDISQIRHEELWPYAQAIDEIIALLEEREPLEPTRVEIEQAGPLYHRCYCKKCGHHVGNMINNKVTVVHENFCSSCGQEVRW